MNHELITVIIPTFGRTLYLEKTLVSVIDQSYDNLEIIVVDDNGENSPTQLANAELLNRMNFKNRKFKYIIHEKNKNGAAARNTGIKSSTGSYICFLDDDDVFTKYKIENQYKRLVEYDDSWIASYSGHQRINNVGESISKYISSIEGRILFEVLMFRVDACTGSTLMVKREALKSVSFDESLDRFQDYQFLADIAAKGKILSIKECSVKIRTHDGNNRLTSIEKIIENRYRYLLSTEKVRNILTKRQQKEVLRENYFFILKECLKHKELKLSIKFFVLCGNPIWTLYNITKDMNQYKKRIKK